MCQPEVPIPLCNFIPTIYTFAYKLVATLMVVYALDLMFVSVCLTTGDLTALTIAIAEMESVMTAQVSYK